MAKGERPFWQTFRKASEENLMKLPKKKPSCIEGKAHRFMVPSPDGSDLAITKCRHCGLRWIVRIVSDVTWWDKSDRETLQSDTQPDLSLMW